MTGLFFYKFLFMTELLIVEILFTFRMQRRKYFWWRAVFAVAVCYLAAWLYPVRDSSFTGWYVSVMFLVLFFVTYGAMLFVYKISVKSAFFCAIAAYTTQHFTYEIFKLGLIPFNVHIAQNLYGNELISFSNFNWTTVIAALVFLEICIVVYVSVYFVLGKKIASGGELHLKNTSLLVLSAALLLVDIFLNAIIVYIEEGYNANYDIIVGIYNCLCCIFVFYVQRNTIIVKDIRGELETVSQLLHQATRQYEIKKEEIDLINVKCHDLKHQVRLYASRSGLSNEAASEIEQMISIYDATVKTGNEVLDIILTEKSLACQSKGIRLSCMADCSEIGFISDGDLYALFGNILDNAIMATSEVLDEEKRCIGLLIRTVSGVVSVMAQNYYVGDLSFTEDGLLETKSRDKANHGFGLKSIKMIAEKYGGSMSIKAEGDVFYLNLLIPVGKKKPQF